MSLEKKKKWGGAQSQALETPSCGNDSHQSLGQGNEISEVTNSKHFLFHFCITRFFLFFLLLAQIDFFFSP